MKEYLLFKEVFLGRFFVLIYCLFSWATVLASENILREDDRGNENGHQCLSHFLEKFDPVVHEDLKPFFTKAWAAIFYGYNSTEKSHPHKKRLSAPREREHTLCLFNDLSASKENPEMQFIHIASRLDTKTHLVFLSQFYSDQEIDALKSFDSSYFLQVNKKL